MIDFSILQRFATEQRVSYPDLCTAVREAVGSTTTLTLAVDAKPAQADLARVAALVAARILSDLDGRSGLTDELDDEVRLEIQNTHAEVIAATLSGAAA